MIMHERGSPYLRGMDMGAAGVIGAVGGKILSGMTYESSEVDPATEALDCAKKMPEEGTAAEVPDCVFSVVANEDSAATYVNVDGIIYGPTEYGSKSEMIEKAESNLSDALARQDGYESGFTVIGGVLGISALVLSRVAVHVAKDIRQKRRETRARIKQYEDRGHLQPRS